MEPATRPLDCTNSGCDDVHTGSGINEDSCQLSIEDCGSDVSQIEPTHARVLIPIRGGRGSRTIQFWAGAALGPAGIVWGARAPFAPVPPFRFNWFA